MAVSPPSKSSIKKVLVCHIPSDNQENKQTLEIAEPALKAHLAHGDHEGACEIAHSPSTATTTPPIITTPIATTTPPTTTATTTPSGAITATPAQPIGQTGTTTVSATPATPTQTSGGTTPPPSTTPSSSPPSTATTTPPATPPPSPTLSPSIDFALVYITPQVTVAQGGVATVIIHAVPVSGALFPYVYTDHVTIAASPSIDSGGGFSSTCVDDQDNPISCAQPKKVIITLSRYIKSNAPLGSYTLTGLASDKMYPLSWPPGEAVIKNISVPLTITASTSAIHINQSTLASILQSLSAVLDDIQKQIQKLAR